MRRYIDKLPMTIRFASEILRSQPDLPDRKIVSRAHNLATLIQRQMENEPYIDDKQPSHPSKIVRVKTSDHHVDNMWTNGVSAGRGNR